MLKRLSFQLHWYLDYLKFCEVEITVVNKTVHIKSVAGLDLFEADLRLEEVLDLIDRIDGIALETWQHNYLPEGFAVADGFMWSVEYEKTFIRRKETETIKINGSNAYPWCFYQLIRIIMEVAPNTKTLLTEYAEEVKCFYL